MGCGASKKAEVPAEAPKAEPAKEEAKAPEAKAPDKAPEAKAPEPAKEEAPAPAAKELAKEETAGDGAGLSKFKRGSGTNQKVQTLLEKFHSSVRWNKGLESIKEFLTENADLPTQKDEKNGNQALHLASQNGHLEIVKWLVDECSADVNCVNNKKQTALHMSIAYDFYDQSQYLMDKGADQEAENVDGHKAILGIDGDHTGKWAWGSPMHAFKAIKDLGTMEAAFGRLEECEAEMLDKLSLAQTGMKMRKAVDGWDGERFQKIVQRA